MVQAPDIFATIADLANTGISNYEDGISIKPLLMDANSEKRTFIYSEQFGNTSPINDGYAVRNADYKLIHIEDGTEYLYKISTDPFEQNNLLSASLSEEARQNLDQLRQIKAEL
jgi:arylsulfatase B